VDHFQTDIMVNVLGCIIMVIYLMSLLYVTLFCLMQLHLLYKYLTTKRKSEIETKSAENQVSWPMVTIQLPLFNEKYVTGRLIDNIAALDYPKDRMEIHILDDSTDDTLAISRQKVEEYKAKGYHIECYHRTDRSGFKAGALKEGMAHARGEFIAIFDADFLPRPDFLKQSVTAFTDDKIGVVQTRWEHINQSYSLLTEMQAFQLNVHFTIEQRGRYVSDYMLQFNGTAGVWRTSCIHDAGGWEADTLTEDLDLSYRAQMKGWKIKYLEHITAPAELPAEINGLKSQQFRWMKGGAETAKKMLPKVWASELSFKHKFQATVHLLSSSIFIFVFLLGVFSVPLLFLLTPMGIETEKFGIFMLSLMSVIAVYFVANVGTAWPRQHPIKMIFKFIFLFPVFMSLSMGIAFHNSIAVLQGFLGRKSGFVRTPKYGVTTKGEKIQSKTYLSKKLDWVSIGEGILFVYFTVAMISGILLHMKAFVLMHLMLAIGYLMLFYYAIKNKYNRSI
jgi:cellulose synthase/poly-beta-1,6-N-acetylglucosamine synthase-like glycosyltransferase